MPSRRALVLRDAVALRTAAQAAFSGERLVAGVVYTVGIDLSSARVLSNVALLHSAVRFAADCEPKANCMGGCSEHRRAVSCLEVRAPCGSHCARLLRASFPSAAGTA